MVAHLTRGRQSLWQNLSVLSRKLGRLAIKLTRDEKHAKKLLIRLAYEIDRTTIMDFSPAHGRDPGIFLDLVGI